MSDWRFTDPIWTFLWRWAFAGKFAKYNSVKAGEHHRPVSLAMNGGVSSTDGHVSAAFMQTSYLASRDNTQRLCQHCFGYSWALKPQVVRKEEWHVVKAWLQYQPLWTPSTLSVITFGRTFLHITWNHKDISQQPTGNNMDKKMRMNRTFFHVSCLVQRYYKDKRNPD